MKRQSERAAGMRRGGVILAGIALLALILGETVRLMQSPFTSPIEYRTAGVAMDAVCVVFVFCLLVGCILDRKNGETIPGHSRVFTWLVMAELLYLLGDMFNRIVEGSPGFRNVRYLSGFFVNLAGTALVLLLTCYLKELVEKQTKELNFYFGAMIKLGLVMIIVISVIAPGGKVFSFEDGVYRHEDFWYAMQCYDVATLLSNAAVILLRRSVRREEKLPLTLYCLLPAAVLVLQNFVGDLALIAPVSTVTVCICYITIYLRRGRTLVQKERDLSEAKVRSMLLQINPHFIYNTLGSVASLCHTDPEGAERMIFAFSDYLRQNFGEMTQKQMIPFEKEMEHLNTYLAIERQRFPDITIEYDLRETDFEVPGLTVQPLAENAITHGIMGREEGGCLRIVSFADETDFVIRVEDDGVGFESMEHHDGRDHIGVKNVRERLQLLCGGTLQVSSTPGVGTVSEVRIPRPAEE